MQSLGTSTVAVNLFQGEGFGGPLLATSNTLSVGNAAEVSYRFDFVPATLSIGNMYTLQIKVLTGSLLNEGTGSGDPYSGGTAYRSNGTAVGGYDLAFSEGTNAAVTPEPSSLALLGTGLLGVIGAARRRWA